MTSHCWQHTAIAVLLPISCTINNQDRSLCSEHSFKCHCTVKWCCIDDILSFRLCGFHSLLPTMLRTYQMITNVSHFSWTYIINTYDKSRIDNVQDYQSFVTVVTKNAKNTYAFYYIFICQLRVIIIVHWHSTNVTTGYHAGLWAIAPIGYHLKCI